MTTVHQMASSLGYGDAVTNHILSLDAALREWGYTSHIYAERIEPRLQGLARPDTAYAAAGERRDDILIYHYSAFSPNIQLYQRSRNRRVFVYHNITPAEYFTPYDSDLAAVCRLGRDALPQLRDADLAVGDSEINRRELLAAGFAPERAVVLPIALNLAAWDTTPSNPRLVERLSDGQVNVLFVGRVVPNKAFEDVINIFATYRQAYPNARLSLVGPRILPRYSAVLDRLITQLGVGDAVTFTDRIPLADLKAYYETAHVFLSASRHEGFCVPLLESMHFGVPILAYAGAAVPETLGASGVLYHAFDYPVLAETLHLLARDLDVRAALVAGQRARLAQFAPASVAAAWRVALDGLTDAPPTLVAPLVLGEQAAPRYNSRMPVSIVVQRYGPEVLGGAERLARQVAERLADDYEVRVLTTCAQDYTTWANVYPPGESVVSGVRVLRFPTLQTRAANHAQLWERVHLQTHTLADELAWLRAQGPYAPDLLEYLRQHRDESDAYVFFTYLYYPTAMGLRLVADKAILVPTAHDESPIYLSVFRDVFHSPRAILYNTEEERRFVERHFDNGYIPNAVVGVGIEPPAAAQPERFRARFGLDRPYFLYLGRIVPEKGCDEMLDYFAAYQAAYPDEAVLSLVGDGDMALPSVPWLVPTGFVDDQDRLDAIAGAEAVIVPSRQESLSLITLEAWSLGRPVVCTAHSPVVRGLVRRAEGGLYYADSDEFVETLHLLVSDAATAAGLGRQGRDFTQSTYRWSHVVDTYRHFIEEIAAQPWG